MARRVQLGLLEQEPEQEREQVQEQGQVMMREQVQDQHRAEGVEDEDMDSGADENMLGAVQVENELVEGYGFSDSSGSFMHSSDWSDSDEEGVEEKKEEGPRKMKHEIPKYDQCSEKYLKYLGPDARLQLLPQQIKEAGRRT